MATIQMNDENYSKREMDTYFTEVKGRFDSQDEKLEEIREITKATDDKVGIQNGRVTKTEATVSSSVKAFTVAGTVAIFLIGIIMSLIVYSFKISQDNLQAQILLSVEQMIKK